MKRSTYRLTHKVFEVSILRPLGQKIDVSHCGTTSFGGTQTTNQSVPPQEIRPTDERGQQIIQPEPPTRRPTVRCPACLPPYGRHYWQDTYGTWRCTQCHPPAVMAMVRDQLLVSVDGAAAEPAGQADELAPLASSGEFTAGKEFPAYARGRWRYYEDRWGRHWERITYAI